MHIEELKERCEKFREIEGRASFYDIAASIVDNYPLHGSIIILATWNVSRFRFIVNNPQNLVDLQRAIGETLPLFDKLKDKELQTVDFDSIKDIVKQIYSTFSRVKGVEYTGASKVMHLLNRKLFVMWDSYIRKGYGLKRNDAEEYFSFLKNVQSRFENIRWNDANKTLAKAIDEYNYVTYTYPELQKKRGKVSNR